MGKGHRITEWSAGTSSLVPRGDATQGASWVEPWLLGPGPSQGGSGAGGLLEHACPPLLRAGAVAQGLGHCSELLRSLPSSLEAGVGQHRAGPGCPSGIAGTRASPAQLGQLGAKPGVLVAEPGVARARVPQ